MTCADVRRALCLALVFALPSLAAAQAQVKETKPIKLEAPKPKKAKFVGEVLSMTRVAITVRSRDNLNLVRTFTYDEKLAAKMAQLVDRDQAYQHGDRVEIEYFEGGDKAVKVKGKPGQHR